MAYLNSYSPDVAAFLKLGSHNVPPRGNPASGTCLHRLLYLPNALKAPFMLSSLWATCRWLVCTCRSRLGLSTFLWTMQTLQVRMHCWRARVLCCSFCSRVDQLMGCPMQRCYLPEALLCPRGQVMVLMQCLAASKMRQKRASGSTPSHG